VVELHVAGAREGEHKGFRYVEDDHTPEVLPETWRQLELIVSLCAEHAVPLVTRGAGTGLSGGALPLAEGCLLSLARFTRILEIDPDNRTATVEAGVRNIAISEAAAPFGLYYAPDPSSQIACSIGGNVAENSGGVHCLKYGLTVHNVLELKVLTAAGEWLTLGARALDTPGLDVLALMHGSEGMLGIITEITVKLLPKPELARVVLASFESVQAASDGVADIIAAGIVPAGLEMMDALAVEVAEQQLVRGLTEGRRDPYPTGVRQPLDVVDPAAPDDPDNGLRYSHTRLSRLIDVCATRRLCESTT